MSSIQLLRPRGRDFTRALILRAAGELDGAANTPGYAMQRWGTAGAIVEKAALGSLTAEDIPTGDRGAAIEWFGQVSEASVLGRLGLRRVAPYVRCVKVGGARGYWVGQTSRKPLSKPSLTGSSIKPLTVASLLAATRESILLGGEQTEAVLQADLQRAAMETFEESFLDPTNAGETDATPASVTNGVTPIASTGSPAEDIRRLIEDFQGDFASASFVTHPSVAAQIALARDAGGSFAFPDAGPRGGSLLGIPLLTSRASPWSSSGGQIALIDGSGIAWVFEGGSFSVAHHATLTMSDDPENDGGEPVSLFQSGTVAFLLELATNWEVQREGGVSLIEDANYSAGS